MRIKLPSAGIVGFETIELDSLRFSHLRNISLENLNDDQVKTELIRQVAIDKDKVEKLTLWDRDYIHKILISAIHNNAIQLIVECPHCGVKVPAIYEIGKYEGVELPEGVQLITHKEPEGMDYKIPQVEDEYGIIEYANLKSNNDEEYRKHYEDALVSVVLGNGSTEEGVQKTLELPMGIYYSAAIFHHITFHGMTAWFHHTCQKCDKNHVVLVPFTKALLEFDVAGIMTRFQDVSGMVDFQAFLNLSIPEFGLLVEAKNKQQ